MQSSKRKYRTIDSFLQQPKYHLGEVIAKVKQLHEFNQYLNEVLEQPLLTHCKVANVKNDKLILAVDTPAWATRIRYMIPDLVNAFQKKTKFKNIKQIQCIISPKNFEKIIDQNKPSEKLALSSDTISLLKTTAQNIQDKSLKKALLKLAHLPFDR